jgi:hypothetical protein
LAFLPALTIQDYEKRNHDEQISIMMELEKEAKTRPVYYMWFNASCHVNNNSHH